MHISKFGDVGGILPGSQAAELGVPLWSQLIKIDTASLLTFSTAIAFLDSGRVIVQPLTVLSS